MAEKNPQNNAKYWEKRIAQKTWSAYNDLEEKNRFLLEFYQDASKNIREEIYEIAEKYSKDGTLSRTDMYRFNHYDNLDKKIQKEIEELGKKQFELTSEEMKNGFRQVYENVSVELGEPDFTMLDKKLMEELLDRPWRGDSFSKRTWKNLKRLAAALNDQLLTGLQQGKTATEIAISLNNIMGQGFNAAHRLVRTETMHYLNQAALQSYKDRGVEHVQFCAAADERTCPECGRRHRKIYELEKALILPIHPNCRCTYLPVVEDIDDKQRDFVKPIENSNKSGIIKEKKGLSKMDLQFFSEKDIYRQNSTSLKRGIRSYKDVIDLHKDKISKPEEYCPDWNEKDPRERAGLLKHWKKEIQNAEMSINDRIDELKKRGDYDE